MRVVIIEDETAAARNLQAIVRKVIPEAEVLATLESVEETVEWFSAHPCPDLLFMDIHLADGESFRVFDRIDIPCPIIFTTAYDQYALEAFKVNSIDYLLKPIKEEELARAIEKMRRLSGAELAERREGIAEMARSRDEQKVFLIPVRDKIIPLRIEQVAFFYTTDERVRARPRRELLSDGPQSRPAVEDIVERRFFPRQSPIHRRPRSHRRHQRLVRQSPLAESQSEDPRAHRHKQRPRTGI